MDNLGAIVGPLLALGLVSTVGVRWAIGLSVIPGILAAFAIVYAIAHTRRPTDRECQPLRFRVRPVLRGRLGELLAATAAFEFGNVAATLLILRATTLLTPGHGSEHATQLAIGLDVAYNVAATLASIPAGRIGDRLGDDGPIRVMSVGVTLFGVAYLGLAPSSTSWLLLGLPFIAAGIAIGCIETAEHAATASLAPDSLRGSAFGMLATIQSLGNLAASAVAGLLWTAISPSAAFIYLATWMLIAVSD